MLAEKVRIAVTGTELSVAANKRIGLSISLGVAGCCTSADDIDTLVRLADSALYASKLGGRNKVSVMPE